MQILSFTKRGKSKLFYICHTDEFGRKASNGMTKIRAYEAIVSRINPYADILHASFPKLKR